MAVDNSPHSQVAVAVVLNRTWPSGSKFKVFCAVERREPIFAVMKRKELEVLHNRALEAAKEFTASVANQLSNKFPDCSAESEAVFGDCKEMILERINSPIDLVVVGSHGRHGLPRFFLGSVSQTVLLYGQCSTLIARYQNAYDTAPEINRNILLAVDDTPHSKIAIDWVMNMRWQSDAQFNLLSVMPPLVENYTDGIDALLGQFSAERRELKQKLEKFLNEYANRLERTLRTNRIRTDLCEGDAAEKILLVAREWPAGLVVMGSRSHGHLTRWFIGSVSQEVVLQAPCPVQIVKQPFI